MNATHFHCTTLPDSWFQLVYNLMRNETIPKTVYQITSGSYVGQKRLEYEFVTVQIDHPGERPLIPEIPPHLNIPPPVESMDYVEEYFANYLMNPELEPNETYRYSSWLAPGVERVIEQLKGSAGNNQAAISLGGWSPEPDHVIPMKTVDENGKVQRTVALDTDNYIDPGTGQRDPACLRITDFRLDQNNTLHMFVYFRSWDLFSGYPSNVAGLQLLKEFVAQEIGAKDGKIIAASKGAHIYDHAIAVAATRLGMENVASMDDFLDYAEKETYA